MGGGEVARYMTKYSGAGIAQAGLIASIVPYKLKTPDNPHGTEEKVLDETLAAIKEDRAEVLRGVLQEVLRRGRRRTRERGAAAVVMERGDAGGAERHPRLRGVVLQDGLTAGSRVIQGADTRHPRPADENVPIDSSGRPRRKASRIRRSSNTKVRRMEFWRRTRNA